MDANAKSFTFLSNEDQVTIPFFQRGYIWDKENWEDLLADLLNSTKSHFLGSLILKQQPALSGEPREVVVIDGQQRLTTLSILVKALYDTFEDDIKEDCKAPLRNHLFFKKYPTDRNYLVRIRHSHVDAEAYTSVICAGLDSSRIDDTTYDADAEENRILKCYKWFVTELRKKPEDDRTALFNRILNHTHKMLVVIDLTEADDEQTIFDTTNTAGVRLSCADIIKNALFQRSLRLFDSSTQVIELYEKTWEKVFVADDDIITFWEAKRQTGRLMRDNIEILLHSIAVIKGFYNPDEHTLSDLSRLYKKQIESYKDEEALRAFIEEIHTYGDIYRAQIPSFDNTTAFAFENATQRLFHILDALQITTFHPFVLFVLYKYDKDECMRDGMLASLEKFVIRRVISKQETKSFNKKCRDFISSAESLAAAMNETSDDEVFSGFKGISNKNAALILFWVELRRRSNDGKYDTKELKYDYSLEHVMPQKWETHLKDLPEKMNVDGKIMTPEESKKDRYERVYWLGNMTLLTSSLNSALRNYGFEKKMNGEGRKKGIKAYASLSITKDDIVSSFEGGDTMWDESKIEARTARLGEEVLGIWGSGGQGCLDSSALIAQLLNLKKEIDELEGPKKE